MQTINITIDEHEFMDDDPEFWDHSAVLGVLLAKYPHAFFVSSGMNVFNEPTEQTKNAISVTLNANDIFAWAMADFEIITTDDLAELYEYTKQYDDWGIVMFMCKQRNMQPQSPIVYDMKKANVWTEEMDSLPENEYDQARKKYYKTQSLQENN